MEERANKLERFRIYFPFNNPEYETHICVIDKEGNKQEVLTGKFKDFALNSDFTFSDTILKYSDYLVAKFYINDMDEPIFYYDLVEV